MQAFFPGFAMDIQPAATTSDLLMLRIRTEQVGTFHLPSNVGYGPYRALPIVTAALSAEPNQLLLVDSPDAHLHPACQNKMAKFLAKVAATNVQIIVETHNDHFVNGARQAVKDGTIKRQDLLLHYFGPCGSEDGAHEHRTISVDQKGAPDQWPKGFCDQYEADLAQLTDWE